ncbi:MAG: 16S rRNA (guanine(966)-N(2))-methyltransferase RsmD, partial [Candidatus Latescibacterota bacterium]
MRILGGEAKGRRMRVPGRRVRPTKGVVKKALFELLEDIRGAKVLDLFAGAGGVGLEALS